MNSRFAVGAESALEQRANHHTEAISREMEELAAHAHEIIKFSPELATTSSDFVHKTCRTAISQLQLAAADQLVTVDWHADPVLVFVDLYVVDAYITATAERLIDEAWDAIHTALFE